MLKKISFFEFPPLEIEPIRHSLGEIRYCLKGQTKEKIKKTEEVKVSSRRKAILFTLESKYKILLTDWKSCPIPSGIHGVLLVQDKGGPSKWLFHKDKSKVSERIKVGGLKEIKKEVFDDWNGKFRFNQEVFDRNGNVVRNGLRLPQIGALHSIGAHWTLSKQQATVVMPTGTGKTEVMISSLVTFVNGALLVVVPSKILREQTANKFLNLGILRELGNVTAGIKNPIVGVIRHRPDKLLDLNIFDDCNVIVATIATLAQSEARKFMSRVADKSSCLIIDEAHHIGARTWEDFRDHFSNKPILQFTATPFRRDGRIVDGKVIYNYSLSKAQEDGYFTKIQFKPVFELDSAKGDESIAKEAIKQLYDDIKHKYDHLIMARCDSIERAKEVEKIYKKYGKKFNPLLIHSEMSSTRELLENVGQRKSRIIICVDMLGEGFDMPNLKIAALHDPHKSLSVTLQFIGRFARTTVKNIGQATVIANIAMPESSSALDRLFSEDADWNKLLSEFSSEMMKEHTALVDFIEKSKRIDHPESSDIDTKISPKNLFPKFSFVAFAANEFNPKTFHKGVSNEKLIEAAWINEEHKILYFITKSEPRVLWSRSKNLNDREFHLYIVHFNPDQKVLYIHSSDKESLYQELAQAVTNNTATLISGDKVFRCLGGIARLMFQNVGLKRHGRRNLRFSMYTGADVAEALAPQLRSSSTKSNVFGQGYAGGFPITMGCSYKGRIWSKDCGTIKEFVDWCSGIGTKLLDSSIDTDAIIENVLIPKEVLSPPRKNVLAIDWPHEILLRSEESIRLKSAALGVLSISQFSINYESVDFGNKEIIFLLTNDKSVSRYSLKLKEQTGFEVVHKDGTDYEIQIGKIEQPLAKYLTEYPPNILYVDGSELDGCFLIEPKEAKSIPFPSDKLLEWSWEGIDIRKESQWKDGVLRKDSVQYRMSESFEKDHDFIFDDDGAGEAADLICIHEQKACIEVSLLHCKFSSGDEAGKRVGDLYEVCGQAVRSAKWAWRFEDLCKHMNARVSKSSIRFIKGDSRMVANYQRLSRFKEVKFNVYIVQPGLSKTNITSEQATVLAASYGYILETTGVSLFGICSK